MKPRHLFTAITSLLLLALTPCLAKDAVVEALQQKLAAAGFDPKGIDGNWGKGTETALKAWQNANGLPPSGRLEAGSETVTKLGLTLPDTTEAIEITKLMADGRIDASTSGNNIQSVSVTLKSKVPYPLSVAVPVGTFFVCGGGGAQNMVGTSSQSIFLDGGESHALSIQAACANRERAIPDSRNRFSIRSSPAQKELAVLVPVLDEANAPYSVRQAAVWIVTDNADYHQLGVLVSRPAGSGFGGTRVIDAEDTATAMQLVQKAGINLKNRRIWSNRAAIAKELGAGELKDFLLGKNQ